MLKPEIGMELCVNARLLQLPTKRYYYPDSPSRRRYFVDFSKETAMQKNVKRTVQDF